MGNDTRSFHDSVSHQMQSNTISIAALYFSDDKVRTEAVAAHDAKTRFGPLGNESDTANRKQKPNQASGKSR